jgi:hypothetical protein
MYPRSLPFRSPPVRAFKKAPPPSKPDPLSPDLLDAREMRLRRWFLRLAVGTVAAIALVMVLGLVGVYWIVRTAPAVEPPAGAALSPSSAAATEPKDNPGPPGWSKAKSKKHGKGHGHKP